VSAQKYKTQINAAVHDTQEILDFLGVEKIGVSREDDEMRKRVRESLTPFEKKQMKVNEQLRAMKEAANLKNKNRTKTTAEAAKEANKARQNYKEAKKNFDKGMHALRHDVTQMEIDQKKSLKSKRPEQMSEEEKQAYAKEALSTAEDVHDNKAATDALEEQQKQIQEIWDGIGKSRDPTEADKKQEFTADMLGNLPELDPKSWENLREYDKKDQEIEVILGELLVVNDNLKEMAEQFRDEGKKQEALIRQNKKNVEQNLETAKKANKRIEEVKDAIGGKGPGRICIYVVLIILIIAVAYGVYTLANGEDPCKEYNDQACTGMSNWKTELQRKIKCFWRAQLIKASMKPCVCYHFFTPY